MAVDHQEAMSEPQSSERNEVPVVGGASAATIESLRARLLAERAASKEAREFAHKISLKVSELQSRLDAEVENRRTAEEAMKEVLEVLRIKGVTIAASMAATFSTSGSSESGEAAHRRSSKDGDSEHSSSEDAYQAHSESHQGSAQEELHVDGSEWKEEEKGFCEDSSSDQRQSIRGDSLTTKGHEVNEDRVGKDEEVTNVEQAVAMETLEEHLPWLSNQVVEEGSMNQSYEMGAASAKQPPEGHVSEGEAGMLVTDSKGEGSPSYLSRGASTLHEGESNMAPTVNWLGGNHQVTTTSSSHVDEGTRRKGVPLDVHAMPVTQFLSGIGNKDVHANGGWQSARELEMTKGLTTKDRALPAKENGLGLGHMDVQPGNIPRSGHPYEPPNIKSDPLQRVHYALSAEAPLLREPISTGYPAREFLRPNLTDYGWHPQAPISDAILSLIDDKNGKLGSILMALNLAKQQVSEEEWSMEEIYQASSPSPYSRRSYHVTDEGIPYQPPFQPWKQAANNQVPIIHFPVSPKSDYEPTAFDRRDGVRNGLSSAYYTPKYDPYLQSKGELHLGNGITLYTDFYH